MRGKPYRYTDLRGGLNLLDAAYLVESGQARDLMNVVSTSRGAVRKRDGSTRLASFGPTVTPHSLYAVENVASCLLAGVGTTVQRVNADGSVSTPLTGVANAPWSWVQAPGAAGVERVYGVNGTEAKVFDGSTFSNWTVASGQSMVGMKYLAFAGNRVFSAGLASKPDSFFISKIGDPLNTEFEIQVDPADGDEITGFGSAGPYVLVFKRKKVFAVFNLDNGANRRIADGVGCIAPRTVVETPQGTFFLSDRGVRRTDGAKVDEKPVSENVAPMLDRSARLNDACAASINDRYYLAFGERQAQHDTVLDLDLQTGSWWRHSLPVQQFAPWRRIAGAGPELYSANAAGSAADRLFVPDTPTDVGQAFEAWWTSAWLTWDAPFLRKRVRSIHMDGSGSFDAYVARDFSPAFNLLKSMQFVAPPTSFGGAGTFAGTGTFGGDATASEGTIHSPGIGRAWSLKFYSNNTDPFEVDSFTFAVDFRKN